MSLFLLTTIACFLHDPHTTGLDSGDTGDTGEAAPAALPSDFPASLTEPWGCGDMTIDAHDPAQTVRLRLDADLGLAAAACTSGPQSVAIALPDAEIALVAEVGTHLSEYSCNDDIDNQPVVTRAWTATAGTLTFDVVTRDTEECVDLPFADVTLTLTDVVFTPDDGGTGAVTVPAATFEAGIGGIPG